MNARRRHVPLRSCVACRTKTAKRELLRIVAKPEGGIVFDAGGKLSGRGAYVCSTCADSSENIRKGRLEHTLRTGIADAQWGEVLADMQSHVDSPAG